MIDKQYPIGKFEKPEVINRQSIEEWIEVIKTFPQRITNEVENLSHQQLDTPYREGGWTARQVVHHCADSHMNALCRIKLALTEDHPVIKPYREDKWAELADTKELPVDVSLLLLKGLHWRWAHLLSSLDEKELQRKYIHPAVGKETSIAEAIGMYAWHCKHHLAHISSLRMETL
ncbi:putative metal-dependent hydrolase [Antarcticibacterium sp. 1MA-6-2]|uniref:YfiT family bacillithiol transferase n=1 Tax=Antarcticibacterium sp. 1MA-6-2 TaxID=2908210 RepID=UPI001F219E05|nr:putative metal-dependent hydrolase [Antarcticibacterium sp. 1MA-6-2]UJH90583.1 putative metal-dependent hydrolase [Antarcticibacterium sp. 1MA-6-2]